ncbi:MAG: ADP-ribosylglycohydrolase family protein [Candidatus Sungbacteria bacterium]|nr:ADP-ribosylglycohydrolase family protein [Candidatus Sungbacteria bacterium]
MANGLLLREKALGCLLGVYIGDALGAPWECRTRDEIVALAGGRVERYFPASATHKFLPNWPAGKGTDDTDFTDAIVRAYIITKGQFNMDEIARQHVLAFERSSAGCGKGSKAAIERLKAGVHWSEAAVKAAGMGAGNGVAMKIAPLGIAGVLPREAEDSPRFVDTQEVRSLAKMTHATKMGIVSGLTHAHVVTRCVLTPVEGFQAGLVAQTAWLGFLQDLLGSELENLSLMGQAMQTLYGRLKWLAGVPPLKKAASTQQVQADLRGPWRSDYGGMPSDDIVKYCGSGGFLVHDSLPFSYAYFLRSPLSIDALYDVVSAGGDADTNGSFVGSMLGALHGRSIFPQHLVDGLVNSEALMERAEAFCNAIGL